MLRRITPQEDNRVPWMVVVFVLTILVFAACYIVVSHDIHTVISHLFYIPIIISAWFFPLIGIIYAAGVAVGYLTLDTAFLGVEPNTDAIYRSLMFIVVGVIVSLMSRHLHQRERTVRGMIEQMRSGVLRVSRPSGRIILSNAYMHSILSPESESIIGRSLYEFAANEDEMESFLMQCCSIEIPHPGYELKLKTSKSDEHWFIVSGFEDNPGTLLLTMQDTTIRRRMEEEIEVNRVMLRNLIDSIPEAVWLSDPDGNALEMNLTCRDLLNIPKEKVPSFPVYDLLGEDHFVQIRSEIDFAVKNLEKRQFTVNLNADENEFLYEVQIMPVVSNRGSVVQIAGIIRNITEQQRLIRKIREQEAFLRTILDGLPVATLVIDADHRVLYVNQALSMLFEHEVDSLIGTKDHSLLLYDTHSHPLLVDVMVEDDVDLSLDTYYEGMYIPSPTVPGAFEIIGYYPQVGESGKWIRATAARIVDSSGDIIGAIETFEDYTSQKEASDALLLREERFKLASHIATDLIFEYNIQSGEIQWFGDVDRRLGYSYGHLKHDLTDWVNHIYHEDRDRFLSSLRYHESTGEPLEEEIRVNHKTKSIRTWVIKGVAMVDAEMQHIRTVGIVSDITDIREIEEAKRKALFAIEQNIQQFAILGDHIRNPLQAIAGYNDIQGGDYMEKINVQVRKVNEIVDQLDKGWIESESIRDFLKRHYKIEGSEEK